MSVTRGTCTWGAEKSLAQPGRKQSNVYLDSLVTLLTRFPVLTSCSKLVVIWFWEPGGCHNVVAEYSSILGFDFVFWCFPTFRRTVMHSRSRQCRARRASLLAPWRWKPQKLPKRRETTLLPTKRQSLWDMKLSASFRFMVLQNVKFRATQSRQNTKSIFFKSS